MAMVEVDIIGPDWFGSKVGGRALFFCILSREPGELSQCFCRDSTIHTAVSIIIIIIILLLLLLVVVVVVVLLKFSEPGIVHVSCRLHVTVLLDKI